MSIHPLEVAHDVEEELAYFDGLCPAAARTPEILFRCAGFDLPKNLLLAEELAGCPCVFRYKHGRRSTCVVNQPVDHVADFLPASVRKADAAFDALGGERHQVFLDNVPGMLEVASERHDFRQ